MILIAHRANINGPDPENENSLRSIDEAISMGYDCEIDVRFFDDNFYLGHDKCDEKISISDILIRSKNLWIHVKNVEALNELAKLDLNYFWHDKDFVTLTSNGSLWYYPNKNVFLNGINVMPEWNNLSKKDLSQCAGICSDYISRYR